MSLYDGLEIDGEGKDRKSDVSGWSSGLKLIQSQLQVKKSKSSPATGSSRRRGTSALPPVVDLKRNKEEVLQFDLLTGKLQRRSGAPPSTGNSPFIANEPTPSLTGVVDEYDPFRPNDYEEIIKKKKDEKHKEREEDRKRDLEERERRRKERHARHVTEVMSDNGPNVGGIGEFDRRKRTRREDEEEEEINRGPKRSGGAAIAPPASLLEETQPVDNDLLGGMDIPPSQHPLGPNFSIAGGGSVASKIMARYGYKAGQGLGKKEQGMSMALQVEKTSKRGGKIIHEKDIPKVTETPRVDTATTNANLLKNPSKVVLLQNMVGPGEVDEELEPETAEECTKYGKVVKCIIFEIPEAPDYEAVRIFVEFERMEAAIKAIVDLNGRYFGGRIVKACFYNLDKFRRLDLADAIPE